MAEIVDRMKRDLISTWIKKGFEDEDDLYFYIQQILGFTIPREKFCYDHSAPWDFIRQAYFDKIRFALLYGSRTSGKCLEANSLILDPKTGIRHRIDDVVNNEKLDEILTMTEDGQIVRAPITARWYTGRNKCLRFTLASGRSITTTYEHPFMTPNGWQRADELSLDTCVATPTFVPFPDEPVSIPDAHVDLLAVLLSEGSYTHDNVGFSTADKRIIEIMKNACSCFNGVWVSHSSNYDYYLTQGNRKGLSKRRNPIREMLYNYGITHEKANNKRIPSIIFQLDRRQLTRFLSLFWMCDGYVTMQEAEIGLSSRGMVEDIQHLLLRFGIQSKVAPHKMNGIVNSFRVTVYASCNKNLASALNLWGMKRYRLLSLSYHKNTGWGSGRPPITREFVEYVRDRLSKVEYASREEIHERNRMALDVLGWNVNKGTRQRRIGAALLYSGSTKTIQKKRLGVLCDEKGMGREDFELLLSDDIWWDKIVDIKKVYNVKTYDLTVEPTHSFVANDIIVHNTWGLALVNHLKMLYRQCPIEVAVAASTRDQAKQGYAHFLGFFSDPILAPLVYATIESKTTLINRSELIITSGTMKGLNGLHSQIVSLDEVELMPYELLGEALSISMSKKDKVNDKYIQSQDFLGSTRKKSIGTMSRLLEEAEEKQMSIFNVCVFETLERCTRLCKGDKNWGDCVVWDKCRGRAHDCNGWYPIADFIQKVVNIPRPQFEAQWENKSPSGGPKVFGSTWDEKIHVLSWVSGGIYKSFFEIFNEKEIPKEWRKIGGMDFGSNFAYLSIAIEPKYGIWIVFFEYFYKEERLMSTHADKIMASPYFMQLRRIYGDPSAKQGIIDMNDLLRKKAKRNLIYPAMNALLEGVDAVKKKLEVNPSNGLPGLFVMDNCIELRREFREWEHEVLPDGKPDLESFEDGNDHSADSLRYACYTYMHRDQVSYRFATVKGL